MDTTFPHNYECERLTESRTTTRPHFYFPNMSRNSGRDGLFVEVRPENGEPWLGTFAFGQVTSKGVSGVFATPDPHRLCVVSQGEGYLVSVTTPASWEAVQAVPIIDVRCVRAQGIIVFANFTELVAYDSGGIKWRTKRLTWDGLRITEVTDAFIRGEFWDIGSEATASFIVDLATGEHQGGIRDI